MEGSRRFDEESEVVGDDTQEEFAPLRCVSACVERGAEAAFVLAEGALGTSSLVLERALGALTHRARQGVFGQRRLPCCDR
jgi:hypothetical protein